MKEIFEPLPLIAAGIIGGITMVILVQVTSSYVQDNNPNPILLVAAGGVVTGILVQIGVRTIGVS